MTDKTDGKMIKMDQKTDKKRIKKKDKYGL